MYIIWWLVLREAGVRERRRAMLTELQAGLQQHHGVLEPWRAEMQHQQEEGEEGEKEEEQREEGEEEEEEQEEENEEEKKEKQQEEREEEEEEQEEEGQEGGKVEEEEEVQEWGKVEEEEDEEGCCLTRNYLLFRPVLIWGFKYVVFILLLFFHVMGMYELLF